MWSVKELSEAGYIVLNDHDEYVSSDDVLIVYNNQDAVLEFTRYAYDQVSITMAECGPVDIDYNERVLNLYKKVDNLIDDFLNQKKPSRGMCIRAIYFLYRNVKDYSASDAIEILAHVKRNVPEDSWESDFHPVAQCRKIIQEHFGLDSQ